MDAKQKMMILVTVLSVILFSLLIYAQRISNEVTTFVQSNANLQEEIRHLQESNQAGLQSKEQIQKQEISLEQNNFASVTQTVNEFLPTFYQPYTKSSVEKLKSLMTEEMRNRFQPGGPEGLPTSAAQGEVRILNTYYTPTDMDKANVFAQLHLKYPTGTKASTQYVDVQLVYEPEQKKWLVDEVLIYSSIQESPKGQVN